MTATRILKNNTTLTTIWNRLKPQKEFWEADTTIREIMSKGYFSGGSDDMKNWPEHLRESKDKELVMSAFGALVCYLQTVGFLFAPILAWLFLTCVESSKLIGNSSALEISVGMILLGRQLPWF